MAEYKEFALENKSERRRKKKIFVLLSIVKKNKEKKKKNKRKIGDWESLFSKDFISSRRTEVGIEECGPNKAV